MHTTAFLEALGAHALTLRIVSQAVMILQESALSFSQYLSVCIIVVANVNMTSRVWLILFPSNPPRFWIWTYVLKRFSLMTRITACHPWFFRADSGSARRVYALFPSLVGLTAVKLSCLVCDSLLRSLNVWAFGPITQRSETTPALSSSSALKLCSVACWLFTDSRRRVFPSFCIPATLHIFISSWTASACSRIGRNLWGLIASTAMWLCLKGIDGCWWLDVEGKCGWLPKNRVSTLPLGGSESAAAFVLIIMLSSIFEADRTVSVPSSLILRLGVKLYETLTRMKGTLSHHVLSDI